MKIFGAILIAVSLLLFSYQGVIWVQGEETVGKVGPVEVKREKDFPIPLAPILGGAALVGGIVMLLTGRRENA